MNNLTMDKKVINIINDSKDLNLTIKEKEDILINYFNDDVNNLNINLDICSNNKIVINVAVFNKKNINIKINGIIKGNDNNLKIIFRGIACENNANVDVLVKTEENTQNNIVLEDLKGINENGTITLMPILEVDTNNVDASHFATVGAIEEDKLFYLTSKGITKENAYNILKNVFIYNIFDKDFIKLIKK